jgi:peptidoglycan/LPS O-acetylase OafA/YrhL
MAEPLTSPPKSVRQPELDGIRGIACLMILVFHYLLEFGQNPA